ncbi:hypothetical protein HYH03_009423 [Edaphochlamys debaryana]|uniref:Protein kinase domain-containing protein n=1 Tax=Edaphochlamys debaryana TaxID=47281 RepID=A0A836BYE8_9CHLO|nr:hypothetical protein HYH03_009423 [Edaphochlamys debaryana]|eukprot:KAG2492174.1 hypothetical protein HYH03_009423 [Edaphochlamys debaryana]
MREARMLGSLRHANITRLIECISSKSGRIYLVLEYVGPNLLNLLRHVHPTGLPPGCTKAIAWQLAQAVSYMHSKKILHRDIKPANVLLDPASGAAKLCDLGLARPFWGGPREAHPCTTYCVTRWYRPPEVLVGDDYGPAVDVWSLGCTLAELATGRVLFPGKSPADQLWRILCAVGPMPQGMAARLAFHPNAALQFLAYVVPPPPQPMSLRSLLPDVEPRLFELVEACLRLDPATRPTACELLDMPYFWDVGRCTAVLPAVAQELAAADLDALKSYSLRAETANSQAAASHPQHPAGARRQGADGTAQAKCKAEASVSGHRELAQPQHTAAVLQHLAHHGMTADWPGGRGALHGNGVGGLAAGRLPTAPAAVLVGQGGAPPPAAVAGASADAVACNAIETGTGIGTGVSHAMAAVSVAASCWSAPGSRPVSSTSNRRADSFECPPEAVHEPGAQGDASSSAQSPHWRQQDARAAPRPFSLQQSGPQKKVVDALLGAGSCPGADLKPMRPLPPALSISQPQSAVCVQFELKLSGAPRPIGRPAGLGYVRTTPNHVAATGCLTGASACSSASAGGRTTTPFAAPPAWPGNAPPPHAVAAAPPAAGHACVHASSGQWYGTNRSLLLDSHVMYDTLVEADGRTSCEDYSGENAIAGAGGYCKAQEDDDGAVTLCDRHVSIGRIAAARDGQMVPKLGPQAGPGRRSFALSALSSRLHGNASGRSCLGSAGAADSSSGKSSAKVALKQRWGRLTSALRKALHA